ncbi:hypothetical protein [Embleya sp. AB8]|uniref:hypothetical protein n=1 Tax=Embleya sp. AB8 TaxID=3156304 RepID=UPI003C7308EA
MTGLVALALVVAHYGPNTTSVEPIAPLFVTGLGMGAVFAPLFPSTLVPPHKGLRSP